MSLDNSAKDGFPLKLKVSSAFLWSTTGSVARSLLGFFVNILLARILGPKPFGILAISMTILGLSTLVIDSGLGTSLIQRKFVSNEDKRYVFTWQMIIGLVLSFIIVLIYYILRFISNKSDVAEFLPFIAIVILVQAFSQVSSAILKRELKFKIIQIAQIISYLIGYLSIGAVLAISGMGVWSLLLAQGSQVLINSSILFFCAKHSVKPMFFGSKSIMNFGIRILGVNIINWLSMNLDTVLIGINFGQKQLGLYNRMNFLIGTPVNILNGSIQGVLLSAVAVIQDKIEKIKDVFIAINEIIIFFSWPILISFCFISKTLITGLYGAKWEDGISFIVPVSIAMMFAVLGILPGPILAGLGKAELELRQTSLNFLITLPIIIISSQISIYILAWSLVASRFSFIIFMYRVLWKELSIDFNSYMRSITRIVATSVIFAIVICIVNYELVLLDFSSQKNLLWIIFFMGAIYLFLLFIVPRHLFSKSALKLLMSISIYQKAYYRMHRQIGDNIK